MQAVDRDSCDQPCVICDPMNPAVRNTSSLRQSCFSGDEDELARSRACLLKTPVKCFELFLALEQVHVAGYPPQPGTQAIIWGYLLQK
jgi:hypothetical protein